jgi:hypothetical protein
VIYAKSAKLIPDVQDIYEAVAAKKGKMPFTVADLPENVTTEEVTK